LALAGLPELELAVRWRGASAKRQRNVSGS
jgi:hypothetical protein